MQKISSYTLGLIGLGFWGEKLLFTCHAIGIHLVVTDSDILRLRAIRKMYPYVRTASTIEALLDDPSIHGCIIATPPSTHFHLAKKALQHNKHVLVEKPMTQNLLEARQLIELSDMHSTILMVDHIYLFSPVIHATQKLIHKNSIGPIKHITSIRDTGRRHKRSSVLWDLVPHDISIASFLLGTIPKTGRVMATTLSPNRAIEDAMYQLFYPKHITLQGLVRWNTPIKKRHMEIIGESGAITIEWKDNIETYTVFKSGMTLGQQTYRKQKHTKHTLNEEPMKRMIKHFLECIARNRLPIANGHDAYNSIRTILALERSSRAKGALTIV